MSFLLCHDCYTWVEPREDRCPECLTPIDWSAVDPPRAALQEAIGEILECLGEVQIPRRLLPEWGTLYATTEGLFFVPHEMGPVRNVPDDRTTVATLMGTLLWSRWRFLWPFREQPACRESRLRVSEPYDFSRADQPDPAELLMENPGVFFVSRDQIHKISRKRSRLLIDRHLGGRVTIAPVDPVRALQKKLAALVESGQWEVVES